MSRHPADNRGPAFLLAFLEPPEDRREQPHEPNACQQAGRALPVLRYRYYVSRALLEKQKTKAGEVARVPAPEIEALVLDGVRKQIASGRAEPVMTDRELIECHVERVIIKSEAVEVHFVSPGSVAAAGSNEMAHAGQQPAKITPQPEITYPLKNARRCAIPDSLPRPLPLLGSYANFKGNRRQ